MKLRVLIGILCLLTTFGVKAQCNALFNDTASAPCGVVNFTNLSTGTNSTTGYFWNFPQGTPGTSTLQNPSTTYTANGTYTVCLQMYNTVPSCSSTICQTITVSCFTSSFCAANFNSITCTPSGTNATVSFSNTSSGTNTSTVYDWDFGNFTTSSLASPIATYTANGVYTVCMSYTTFIPATCTASICKTVTINCITSPTCSSNFIYSCTPSGTNAQVSFTNTSTTAGPPTSYNWSFGNSATSTATNPTTTYTANGIYTVCLSVITGSPPCGDSICKTITVTCIPLPTPTCQANFTNTACNNGQMTFYSISSGTINNTTYTWTSTPPPSGPPAPYTATICLKMANHNTVSPTNTCTSTFCKAVYIDCNGIGFEEFLIENSKIKIFPNPSNGLFTLDMNQINLNSPFAHVKVYNVLGELVHQSVEEIYQGKQEKEIDLKNLPNGAYYLRVNSGTNTYSVKLVIAK